MKVFLLALLFSALSMLVYGDRCGGSDLSWTWLSNRALPHLPSRCTELYLTSTLLGDTGAIALSAVLPTSPQLHTLSLFDNGIGIKGVKALAESLSHSQLRVLTLWRNEVGDEGCEALRKSLYKHPTLTTLDLHDAKINAKGAAVIAEVLNSGSIAWLSLSMNRIGDEGALSLAKALSLPSSQLVELHLSDCGISDVGVASLAEALKEQPRFAFNSVNFEKNKLTQQENIHQETDSNKHEKSNSQSLLNEGSHDLFHGLEMLFLSHNLISDVGARSLIQSIQAPEETTIHSNTQPIKGNTERFDVMKISASESESAPPDDIGNPFLAALDLSGNALVSNKLLNHLNQLLSRSSIIERRLQNNLSCAAKDLVWTSEDPSVKKQSLNEKKECKECSNQKSENEFEEVYTTSITKLAVYIPPRCGSLSLMGERLGDEGVTAIAKSLRKRNTGRRIKSLDLSHVGLTEKGLKQLFLAFSDVNSRIFGIQKLFLSSNLIGDQAMAIFNPENYCLPGKTCENKFEHLDSNKCVKKVHQKEEKEEEEEDCSCSWFSELEELDLMHCGVGPLGIQELISGLLGHRAESNQNTIIEQGERSIKFDHRIGFTQNNSRVIPPKVASNSTTNSRQVETSCSKPNQLRTLHLHGNHLGDEGAVMIANELLMKSNAFNSHPKEAISQLVKLDLGMNGIGDIGGLALSQAIRSNMVLQSLYLDYNGMGTIAGIELLSAISENTELTSLSVNGNPKLDDSKNNAISISSSIRAQLTSAGVEKRRASKCPALSKANEDLQLQLDLIKDELRLTQRQLVAKDKLITVLQDDRFFGALVMCGGVSTLFIVIFFVYAMMLKRSLRVIESAVAAPVAEVATMRQHRERRKRSPNVNTTINAIASSTSSSSSSHLLSSSTVSTHANEVMVGEDDSANHQLPSAYETSAFGHSVNQPIELGQIVSNNHQSRRISLSSDVSSNQRNRKGLESYEHSPIGSRRFSNAEPYQHIESNTTTATTIKASSVNGDDRDSYDGSQQDCMDDDHFETFVQSTMGSVGVGVIKNHNLCETVYLNDMCMNEDNENTNIEKSPFLNSVSKSMSSEDLKAIIEIHGIDQLLNFDSDDDEEEEAKLCEQLQQQHIEKQLEHLKSSEFNNHLQEEQGIEKRYENNHNVHKTESIVGESSQQRKVCRIEVGDGTNNFFGFDKEEEEEESIAATDMLLESPTVPATPCHSPYRVKNKVKPSFKPSPATSALSQSGGKSKLEDMIESVSAWAKEKNCHNSSDNSNANNRTNSSSRSSGGGGGGGNKVMSWDAPVTSIVSDVESKVEGKASPTSPSSSSSSTSAATSAASASSSSASIASTLSPPMPPPSSPKQPHAAAGSSSSSNKKMGSRKQESKSTGGGGGGGNKAGSTGRLIYVGGKRIRPDKQKVLATPPIPRGISKSMLQKPSSKTTTATVNTT